MKRNYVLLLFITLSLSAKDIILWDLHQVVLDRSITDTVKALISSNMATGISELTWNQLKELISLSIQNLVHEKSGEDYIAIAKKWHNTQLTTAIIAVANAQRIMPGMQSIIEELNQLGIEQDVGSNIGRTVFDNLIKQPRFTHIFGYMNLKRSQVVEYNQTSPIHKPNPLFFKEYLTKNKLNPDKTRIIFIDDRKANVNAARKLGLIGIHFKDANQLRKELRNLGILVSPAIQQQVRFEGYKHLFE